MKTSGKLSLPPPERKNSEKDAERLLEQVDEKADERNTFQHSIAGTVLHHLFPFRHNNPPKKRMESTQKP